MSLEILLKTDQKYDLHHICYKTLDFKSVFVLSPQAASDC